MDNITRSCETGDQASWCSGDGSKIGNGQVSTLEIENPLSSVKTEKQVEGDGNSKKEATAQKTRKIVEVKQVVACPRRKRSQRGAAGEKRTEGATKIKPKAKRHFRD